MQPCSLKETNDRKLILIVALTGAPADTGFVELPLIRWGADRDHSSIEFRTTHWGIHDIIGGFTDLDITLVADPADFAAGTTIEAHVGLAERTDAEPGHGGKSEGNIQRRQRLEFGLGDTDLLSSANMIGYAVHITCNIRLVYAE